jgi:F0F1-type ATP synthase membrane subunit b/b'
MRRLFVLAAILFLALMPLMAQEGHAQPAAGHGETPAHGEGGHSEGGHGEGGWTAKLWGVPTIAWQIANVLIVVVLFVFLLRRPAPQFFAGRAQEIQGLLEKALKEKEEALARLKDVEEKMAHLGEEVSVIERSAQEAAEADQRRVQAEADASRDRIRKESAEEMERRIAEARRDLRVYAADLAVKMAKDLVAAQITEEDEKALQGRFLKMLEEGRREQRG